jgi:Flp pilus assembly CpaE family ATPase
MKILDSYPGSHELTRWLTTVQPDLLLIDLADHETAVKCANTTAAHSPHTAVIGVGERRGESSLILASIPYPPQPEDLLKAVDQAVHRVRSTVESNLLAFQPAKAGSGSSTIALNTAMALARYRRRVLVLEADLRSGVMSIMLNLNPGHSIQEVLRSRDEMDLFRVRAALVPAHGVDFLLSNRASGGKMPEWEDYFRLLETVKSKYDDILVDLPELVNPGTREIVQRSRMVFSVVTQELLPLKLAERRREELMNWSVPEERIQVLVNRWHKGQHTAEQISKQIGLPVKQVFPNEYTNVRSALEAGGPVPSSSPLGEAFDEFASELAGILPKQPRRSSTGLFDWLTSKPERKAEAPKPPVAIRTRR